MNKKETKKREIEKNLHNAGTVSDDDAIAMFEAMESIAQVHRFEVDEQTGLVNEYLYLSKGYHVFISTFANAWFYCEGFRDAANFAKLRNELENDKTCKVLSHSVTDELAVLNFTQKNPFYQKDKVYTFEDKELDVFKKQEFTTRVETKGDDYAIVYIDGGISSEWKIDNINNTLTNTKCANKLLIGRDEAILRICFPNYN